MTKPRSIKSELLRGEVSIGSWIQLAHPAHAEIMARAGFDWLTVDLEHSVINLREAEELIRIVELCGVVPLVRLSANDLVQSKRVMDAGAHGVIVPMVNTRSEAESAVAAVRYPPRGSRGVGLARAQGYGDSFDDYKKWLERESVVLVQVEHIQAVENLELILSVEGVNGFMVGPYDLSASLGIPGQLDHRLMREALTEILRVAARHPRIAPGYHVVAPRPEVVKEKVDQGYRLIAYSTDMLLLGESCRAGVRAVQACLKRTRPGRRRPGAH